MSAPTCSLPASVSPRSRVWSASVGVTAGIVVWLVLSAVPGPSTFSASGLLFAAVSGLLAGATACGVLSGVAAVAVVSNVDGSTSARFAALARFHVARVVTFAAVGAVVGAVGLAVPSRLVGVAQLVLAAVIVAAVLWILLRSGRPRVPRWRIPHVPELAGVATIAAPCGFTLAVLALAAASASPVTGALLLAVFATATIPGLSLFAAVPAVLTTPRSRLVVLVAAATVAVLAVLPFPTPGSAAAAGQNPTAVSVATDGSVRVSVTITATDYVPALVEVPANVDVWLDFSEPETWTCIATPILPDGTVANTISGPLSYNLGPLTPGNHVVSCPSNTAQLVITAVDRT